MIKLSIIITHHHTLELLDLCLKSIRNTVKGIDHEIIIVDGESKEKNQEFIKNDYPDAKFIGFKKNIGYAKMVNAGLKIAQGEFILILNADIIVLEGAVSELIGFLNHNSQIGIVGPQLLDFTNNIQASCFADPTFKAILARRSFWGKTKAGKEILSKFTLSSWDRGSLREVDWIQGSAIMVRREAIDKVGLLDERFFMYFEDSDWCRRFRENGYKIVYLPSAKMAHYYHRSSKKLGTLGDLIFNKYTRIHIVSAMKYFKKYGFK